jgi:hypothetical protein
MSCIFKIDVDLRKEFEMKVKTRVHAGPDITN